jgi:carbonic anhydrase
MCLMHVDRRDFLRLGLASAVALPTASQALRVEAADAPTQSLSPDQALQKLMQGNARFAAGTVTSPNQTPARRTEVAAGQAPYACILGCADSRVPPEIVFDAGLGDLFVVRVAGNAPNPELLASLDYGVLVLGAPLVMVLGHTACGAVEAALKHLETGAPLPTSHLQSLVGDLSYAVAPVLAAGGDQKANATKLNVQLGMQSVSTSDPAIESAIAGGTLKVVGGIYDLASGVVSPVAPM